MTRYPVASCVVGREVGDEEGVGTGEQIHPTQGQLDEDIHPDSREPPSSDPLQRQDEKRRNQGTYIHSVTQLI